MLAGGAWGWKVMLGKGVRKRNRVGARFIYCRWIPINLPDGYLSIYLPDTNTKVAIKKSRPYAEVMLLDLAVAEGEETPFREGMMIPTSS